ncbi:MAG: UDP-3-O-(3-hydroxymyristoyl)glucosamine N-acyltransferase [Bauldia sp.]|nr:UDP-3-O-(3-hydroxymyristoyl)glucosamine N-acyltransferase [Bauldia sp.]
MTEPRFFPEPEAVTIARVAELTGAAPVSPASDLRITGVASLERAGAMDASYLENRRHQSLLRDTRAAAVFVKAGDASLVPATVLALVVAEPHRAFTQLARHLFPSALRPRPIGPAGSISDKAHIDPSARLEDGVTIEPFAVIGAGAEIGAGTIIGPGAVIGPEVRVGRNAVISAGATLTHALLGDRVVIHPGARIGQDGFGFVPGAKGHLKVPQTGRVVLQDDVEIGANSTIDRGSNRDTVIGEGTKVDNLVQIGHNVVMGRHCLVAGNVGISGSVTIGDLVMIGGGVGIKDNVSIGSGARIAGASAVGSDIPAGETWGGYPAMPVMDWQQERKAFYRLIRSLPPMAAKKSEDSSNG